MAQKICYDSRGLKRNVYACYMTIHVAPVINITMVRAVCACECECCRNDSLYCLLYYNYTSCSTSHKHYNGRGQEQCNLQLSLCNNYVCEDGRNILESLWLTVCVCEDGRNILEPLWLTVCV